MIVTKTIQCGVVNLTNVKKEILEQEYFNLQEFLQLEREGLDFMDIYDQIKTKLYSANAQQALRYYGKKIKKGKEYPISIRKDCLSIKKCDSNVADYFIKIPVGGRYGGVKVPVNTHQQLPEDFEFCESKLFKRNGRFFLNLTIKYEVTPVSKYDGILGVDLGLRNPVVSVALPNLDIQFLGDQIKQIQTKYFYLRRNSRNKKSWYNREHNKVKDQLHKLTTQLADYCKRHKLIFVVGKLDGIQKQDKGRKMNRKLHRFPHYTFRQMMKYKLKERGLMYKEVSEAFTSQICYKCGEKGERKKGIFKHRGSELNSDINGAINVGKRGLGKPEIRSMLSLGASVTEPRTAVYETTSATVSCQGEQNL